MPFVLNDPTQTEIEIHVGDVGTQVILTIYDQDVGLIDLTTSTNQKIRFRKSDNTTLEKTASVYGNPTNGQIVYTLESGDINISGEWNYQGIVTYPSGVWYTNIVKFTVYPNIPDPV